MAWVVASAEAIAANSSRWAKKEAGQQHSAIPKKIVLLISAPDVTPRGQEAFHDGNTWITSGDILLRALAASLQNLPGPRLHGNVAVLVQDGLLLKVPPTWSDCKSIPSQQG